MVIVGGKELATPLGLLFQLVVALVHDTGKTGEEL